jgi:hypothetical protein
VRSFSLVWSIYNDVLSAAFLSRAQFSFVKPSAAQSQDDHSMDRQKEKVPLAKDERENGKISRCVLLRLSFSEDVFNDFQKCSSLDFSVCFNVRAKFGA